MHQPSLTLSRMRSHLARARRLLSASLLVMLVLGLIVRPVLTGLSEVHAAEHTLAMDEHADGHGHPHEHAPDLHSDEGATSEDHGSGTHGLMHQSGGNSTLELAARIEMPPAAPRYTQSLPTLARFGLPLQPPSTPFRPPIA